MIPLYQIIILALIQGITEFLPISSSAHLIFFPKLMGWQDQGLYIDVAVHFGTFWAVVIYFWRDVWSMVPGSLKLLRGDLTPGGDLFVKLVIATIPAVIVGALIDDFANGFMRQVVIIAWASIIFGILLWAIDRFAPAKHGLQKMTYVKSFFVGLIQIFAFIPGASRAGSCITATRVLGFNRVDSARYSCLMSIPIIFAAAAHTSYKLIINGNNQMYFEALVAAAISFVISLASIWFMMNWVKTANFTIFVIYRVALGIGLLAWVYW